jgi:tetratricopeptide (TPR) repeat protein
LARPAAPDAQVAGVVARHLKLAEQYKQAGDLAAAAAQWQILTLLEPGDENFRNELAAARATVTRRSQEYLNAGTAALRAGDADRAAESMLKVLALDPANAEAAQALRDIERRKLSRIAAGRAARVADAMGGTSARAAVPRQPAPMPPADVAAGEAYSLEQPIEMFRAGDTEGGLRDMRRFVEANPTDRASRNRIGTVVYDRAREVEVQGQREQALALYEQAVALRGEPAPGWASRIQALKKTLGEEYFNKGVQAWPTDHALAVKDWEAAVRYDPQNAKATAKLKEAKSAAPDKGARAATK